jgi:hypothetical protein
MENNSDRFLVILILANEVRTKSVDNGAGIAFLGFNVIFYYRRVTTVDFIIQYL